MSTLSGTDNSGRRWTGRRNGRTIHWSSNDGLSGVETVELLGGGRMRGVSATGDAVPCDYDGRRWHSRGRAPDGEYTEDGNYDN